MTDNEIINLNIPEKDILGMLLSNHITHGSSEGALVSAREFDGIIESLIGWKNSSLTKEKLNDIQKPAREMENK